MRLVAVGEGFNAARSAQFSAITEPGRFAAVVALQGLDRLASLGHAVDQYHSHQMQPGALRWFDADDLAAALAPLPQWIGDTRNQQLQPLELTALTKRYHWAQSRYRPSTGTLHLGPGHTSSAALARWIQQWVPAVDD